MSSGVSAVPSGGGLTFLMQTEDEEDDDDDIDNPAKFVTQVLMNKVRTLACGRQWTGFFRFHIGLED